MAVVYKAQDLQLGRIVAIKILRPSLTSDPSFLTRFRQEARNVANLAHPNIVTLHDFGQDGNTYYMVMEYIDGQDLKKIIRSLAPIPIERALHISIQMCAGVGYAHRAGLVHADVKPQNILITGNDTVKVTDFGIAQALSQTQSQERQSVVWGSPHYFAPEQATGEPPNTSSDVYAIGIVMFEMLTGKLPYSGSDQQELALAHIREEVPHVMTINPSIPIHLDRIVHKVMSKEPSQRYRTADQLGRILISYQKEYQSAVSNSASIGQPPASATPAAGTQQPISLKPMVTGNTPPPQASADQPAARPAPAVTSAPAALPADAVPAQKSAAPSPAPSQSPPYAPSIASVQRPLTNQPGAAPAPAPSAALTPPTGSNINQPRPPQSYGQGGGQQAAYAPQQGYVPPAYSSDSSGLRPSVPNYQAAPRPPAIDVVSIILSLLAFGMIIGLVVLWLEVYRAYLP
jgi:serine/threonine-protein kinase